MSHFPDLETFRSLANGADLVPVYRRLVSDALTPVPEPTTGRVPCSGGGRLRQTPGEI